MAVRKPTGMQWETWADRLVLEAIERGEFDNLPGKGKPIPGLDQPYDELWWVRSWMKREGLQWLPDTLQLRLDVQNDVRELARLRSAQAVRDEVERINERIRFGNSRAVNGPPSDVYMLDPERVVADWEAGRLAVREADRSDALKPERLRVDRTSGCDPSLQGSWMAPFGATTSGTSEPGAASGAGSGTDPAMRLAWLAAALMLALVALAATAGSLR